MKTEDLYDSSYDKQTAMTEKLLFSKMRKTLAAAAGELKGNVLEIAVSTGKGLEIYEDQDVKVVGVDLSPAALNVAKLRALYNQVPFNPVVGNVEQLCSALNLEGIPTKFDYIVCQLGFCTFNDPVAVMKEIQKLSTPSTKILLLEHVMPTSMVMRGVVKLFAKKAKRDFGCDPTRDTFGMFRDAGFEFAYDHAKVGGLIHSTILRPPQG
jgi:ubiquinone/menaquinone biosynthesis C-methylase UbiE